MTDPAIIEAAARALYRILYPYSTSFIEEHFAWYHKAKVKDPALAEQSNVAKTFRDVPDVLAAVTPLIHAQVLEEAAKAMEADRAERVAAIREAALEEAAKVAESFAYSEPVAAAIRARKEQPL